ncbi:MAG: Holliday junction branch migration protein RuvA [Leucobacter sp.]
MIASIRGPVLALGAGWVVVGVGGLGLRVEVPAGRAPQLHLGDEASLHTSLIVREDSLTLFGFATEEEIQVFGHLLGVSGVGPRSALGVLSELTPAEVVQAVAAEDEKPFKRVSGIGPKTAKLITVSLSGKLSAIVLSGADAAALGAESAATQSYGAESAVQLGLVGLGWSEKEAALAVQDAREAGAPDGEAALLRAALALLQSDRPGNGFGGRR